MKLRSAAGRAGEDSTQSRILGTTSRAAMYAAVTALLLTAAAPAQAQFGFSWFGGPPQPMVRIIPDEVRARSQHVTRHHDDRDAKRRARAGYQREAAKNARSKPAIVGPLIIVVSVNRQHLTVYDGDHAIASSPVSTGKEGHETPLGVFSVIQKEILHHSNLYDDAPMPYMQRITWSGVALHAGPLPGHAASHGCIRLPREFAVRLWGMTKVGARVIVARDELTPVEFSDPRLFTMREDKPEAPTAAAPASERGAALDATQNSTDAATDRTRAAGQLASLANIPVPRTETPPSPAPAERAEEADAAAKVAKVAAADLPAPSAYDEMAPTAEELAQAAESEREKSAMASAARVAPPASSGPESTAPVTGEIPPRASGATAALTPSGEIKSETESGPSPASETPAPAKAAKPKRAGPISIFVSRKEKKLFVRRGFEPVLAAPIAFEGDQPLGTHVYTAINGPAEGSTMRWVELSITSSELPAPEIHHGRQSQHSARTDVAPIPVSVTDASQALERVQISSELRDRIADMIAPGSSLIISDKGLGSETGRGTDFIVLTH